MIKEADVIIIGAGPVGLFQVFELGLQGINTIVIDSLPHVGGQCRELYPQKPIFDIPGLPQIGAKALIDNLLEQAAPFTPEYVLGQAVLGLEALPDNNGYRLTTDQGMTLQCKFVIVAAGGGSFEPVKLKVKGIDSFEQQVFYRVDDINRHKNKDIVVLGGGDAAFDWALELQKIASSVLLIHRSTKYRASSHSVQKAKRLCDNHEMQQLSGQVTGYVEDGNRIEQLQVTSMDGVTRRVELDHLLIFFGLSPKLAILKEWGLALEHNQIKVNTETFESSREGVYAVGDINWYPGKQKLILSGFHEAALAAFAIKSKLTQGKRVPLLYTTTSPIVHDRLGVSVALYD